MRITGGQFAGIPLTVPGRVTRPTQDRVRESLFSILLPLLPTARVLDLYAGSGALGLEALSRGAVSACFVDRNAAAMRAIEANIGVCKGLEAPTKVVKASVDAFLRRPSPPGPFNLVFADPPYERDGSGRCLQKTLRQLSESPMVKHSAWLVFEQAAGQPVAEAAGWSLQRRKTYGDTEMLVYLRRHDIEATG